LADPDLIQEGDLGTLLAIRFYAESPLTRKPLGGVDKEISQTDGLVFTAYFTSAPSVRVSGWKRARSWTAKPSSIGHTDEDTDGLDIFAGKPRPALGVDIGEGVIVRWDEQKREVVGLTMIGLRARLAESLAQR